MHDFSIVIPHRNQWKQLDACLSRIIELKLHLDNEIIVVDNRSDNIHELPSDIRLIKCQSPASPYIARNLGIKSAKYDQIFLLDCNVLINQAFVDNVNKSFARNKIISGIPQINLEKQITSFERFDYLYSIPVKSEISKPSALPTTTLLFHREDFYEIGEFKSFRSLSDMEWTIRARNQGMNLQYIENAYYTYPFKKHPQFAYKFRRFGKGMMDHKNYSSKMWYIIKQFLPPSPKFISRFIERNKIAQTGLTVTQIILLCYYVKINYGIGALKSVLS